MSKQLGPAGQRNAAVVVCLIFISVGLALWIPGFLLPVLDWSARRKWKEVPCTITKAPMEDGSFGLSFRYEFADEPHDVTVDGDLGFFSMPSERMFRLKSGEKTVCYVNPRAPREAVLQRDFDPELFLWCAPLLFVLLPLLGLVAMGVKAFRPPPAEAPPPGNSVVLASASRRGCSILVQVAFLLLFGGLLALLALLPGFRESLVVRLAYMVPIGLVTLLLLRTLVRTLLRTLHPSVTLTVVPGEGAPGRTVDVRWDAPGGGVKRFKILLEGFEESPHGKSRRTATFATVDVFQGGPKDFKRGSVKVLIPEGVMHSMEHGFRRIRWVFRVSAELTGLPDLHEEYPYTVAFRGEQGP